ncbi:MAG: GNAT family N-acetyltransferase [Sphingomonadaceae bacterium]|nr:GNAT family N-acetyltransferase [Sphingomonadaceae bacterium]
MPARLTPLTAARLRDDPALADALLALNNDHAMELSLLDETGLAALVEAAFLAAHVGIGDALLIAMDQSSDYSSPNFLWFRDRFDRFVYVDRVVTAARARGQGLARLLYRSLFDQALAAGQIRSVCEVNSDPPNPGSDAFHAALGFAQVGSATLENGKTVRYLEKRLLPGTITPR